MANDLVNTLQGQNKADLQNNPAEKYLTFFVNGQLFAVKSCYVNEIIRIQPITYMPNLPPYVKGVINLRGKIVPLIDLRLKLDKEETQYSDHTGIIVTDVAEMNVGLIVDGINDVSDITADQISDSPKLSKQTESTFTSQIATINNKPVMLLDIEKLLRSH